MADYDFIVVGSGIAGLYTALLAKAFGRVLLVTKSQLQDCNTRFAQGGIAAAVGPTDSPQLHYADTLKAGAGLCDSDVVRIVTDEGPDRIRDLQDLGVPFDLANGRLGLAREGAHSIARVLHVGGDATGATLENTLSKRVIASGIDILERHLVIEIETGSDGVRGIRLQNTENRREIEAQCRTLVLATGGCGQLFKFNTNPDVATGDGVALAYRAGAEVMDMEFFQFHPTALRISNVQTYLISEAVRGEGGILRNGNGRRFMPDYDERGELASRDVVSRAIISEMGREGSECVWLDVTHLPAEQITTRFPSIYRFCLEHGIDITKQLIPVAPAAHYMMGGIRTGIWGETTIPGLYACGEAACTGLHGANRLASNSLLEGLVFGKRVVEHASSRPRPLVLPLSPHAVGVQGQKTDLNVSSGHTPTLPELQSLMWAHVGIIRDAHGLNEALSVLEQWRASLLVPTYRADYELSNMLLVGQMMAAAALRRRESRGAHYRVDYPDTDGLWARHIVFRR